MKRRDLVFGTGIFAAASLFGRAGDGGGGLFSAFSHRADAAEQEVPVELKLAEYGLAITYETIPPAIVQKVRQLLTDTIACACGAAGAEPARIAEAAARRTFAGEKTASIIGRKEPISVEGAALVNGVLVRYLDLNDIYVGRDPLHPSEIVPAALAVCEDKGSTGREFIEAVVAGYEAELRINDAVSLMQRGYHPLSAGAFAAPLVAGKVWGLSAQQIANAIGLSGTRGMTLFVVNSGSISMMKALGHALTSAEGIFSTRLAREGFTGPANTLDWVAMKLQPPQPGLTLDLDPGRYRLPFVGLKRFPVQYELQAPVEAGVNLHPLWKEKSGKVEGITVRIAEASIPRVADPSRYDPQTKETADHSLPVCLAMALTEGKLSTKQFEDGLWRRADIKALAGKVKAEAEPALARGKGGVRVEIRFADGTSAKEVIDIPDGHADRPMSKDALEAKFMDFTVPVLGEQGAKAVLAQIDRLDELKDIRLLAAALRGAA